MRTHPVPALCLLATAALSTPPLEAQEPQAQFREDLRVTEVLLDVVVTDEAGNVILGLGPDDFVIQDGDQEVEITSATFYSNRRFLESAALAERLGVTPDEVPVDRFFILFFHDPRALFPDMMSEYLDALRWARRWVHQELLPNDFVAVVSYDHKLKVHQDFTTDNQAILGALDAVARGKDPGDVWPSRQEAIRGPSLIKNMPQGKEFRRATRKIYGGLEVVADAAGYIIGRKNLLFFSVGFGKLNEDGALGGFGTYLPDERYYPDTMQLLNDNNVAVYGISLFRNLADEGFAEEILGNSLSLLADDTGGEYFFNFVNFRDPLRDVVEDNNGYYLLSYEAEHPVGEEGYQKVEVSTRNPNFVVRARQGYRYGV